MDDEMRERISDIIYEAQSWIDDDELRRKARIVAIDAIAVLLEETDRKAREETILKLMPDIKDIIPAGELHKFQREEHGMQQVIHELAAKCQEMLATLQSPSKESK